MAVFRRISYYFILVIMDLHYHLPSIQAALSKKELCAHLAAGTLCDEDRGQTSFPNPANCFNYYQCGRKRLIEKSCLLGRFDYIDLSCTFRTDPRCMTPCHVSTTTVTSAAFIDNQTTSGDLDLTTLGSVSGSETTIYEQSFSTAKLTNTEQDIMTSESVGVTSQSDDQASKTTETEGTTITTVLSVETGTRDTLTSGEMETLSSAVDDVNVSSADIKTSFTTSVTVGEKSPVTPGPVEETSTISTPYLTTDMNSIDETTTHNIAEWATSKQTNPSTSEPGRPVDIFANYVDILRTKGTTFSASSTVPTLSASPESSGDKVGGWLYHTSKKSSLPTSTSSLPLFSASTSSVSPLPSTDVKTTTTKQAQNSWHFHKTRLATSSTKVPHIPVQTTEPSVTLNVPNVESTFTKDPYFPMRNETAKDSNRNDSSLFSSFSTAFTSEFTNSNINLNSNSVESDDNVSGSAYQSFVTMSTSDNISMSKTNSLITFDSSGDSTTSSSETVTGDIDSSDLHDSLNVSGDSIVSFWSGDLTTVSNGVSKNKENLFGSTDNDFHSLSGSVSTETSSEQAVPFAKEVPTCPLHVPCEPHKRKGNPTDCSRYFECDEYGYKWVEYDCAWLPFIYFDTKTNACEMKEYATCQSGCQNLVVSTESTDAAATVTDTMLISDGVSSEDHRLKLNADLNCTWSIPCEPGRRTGNKENCGTYYECEENGKEWVKHECSWLPFVYFDITTQTCETGELATCESGCPYSATNKSNDAITVPVTGNVITSTPDSLGDDSILEYTRETTSSMEIEKKTTAIKQRTEESVVPGSDTTVNITDRDYVHLITRTQDKIYSTTNTNPYTSHNIVSYTNILGSSETTSASSRIQSDSVDEPCTLPLPCQPGTRVGNVDDCTKYFECNSRGSLWKEYTCEWIPFTHFNPQFGDCDESHRAECQADCPFQSLPESTTPFFVTSSEKAVSSIKEDLMASLSTGDSRLETSTPIAEEEQTSESTVSVMISTPMDAISTEAVNTRVLDIVDTNDTFTVVVNHTTENVYSSSSDSGASGALGNHSTSIDPHTTAPTKEHTRALTTEVPKSTEGHICRLNIPCQPGLRVGTKDSCNNYLECNINGSEWILYSCSSLPLVYFDTRTSKCKEHEVALCELGCPDTGLATTERTTTWSELMSTHTNIGSSGESGEDDLIPMEISTVFSGYEETTEAQSPDRSTGKDTSTNTFSSETSETDNVTSELISDKSTNMLGITSESITSSVAYSATNVEDTVDNEYLHVSTKMHDIYSPTNSASSTQPSVTQHDLTRYTNILGSSTESSAQQTTSIPSVSDDGPCSLPLPCIPGKKVGNKDDCKKYIECNTVGDGWTEHECEWVPFHYFDTKMEQCEEQSKSVCQSSCPDFHEPETTKIQEKTTATAISTEITTSTPEDITPTLGEEPSTEKQTTTIVDDRTTAVDVKESTSEDMITTPGETPSMNTTTGEPNISTATSVDMFSLTSVVSMSSPEDTSTTSSFETSVQEPYTTESLTTWGSTSHEMTTVPVITSSEFNDASYGTSTTGYTNMISHTEDESKSTTQANATVVFTTTIIKTTSSQASFDTSSQIITTSEESVTSSSSGETSVPPATDEGSGSDACNRLEPCTVTDMVPDPRDCTKFYVCIKKNGGGSMWQRRPCTSNRKFDQFGLFCSNSADINCHPGCPDPTSNPSVTVPTSQSSETTESQTLNAESASSEPLSESPTDTVSSVPSTSNSMSSTSISSVAEESSESSVTTLSESTGLESIETSSHTAEFSSSASSDRSTRQVSSGETTPDSSSSSSISGVTTAVDETSGTSGSVTFDVFSTVIPGTSTDSGIKTSEDLLNVTDSTAAVSTLSPSVASTDVVTSEASGTFSGDITTSGTTEGSTEFGTTTAGGTVLDHSISVTSEEALEGQDFKLQCSFLLDPPTAQFSLIWSLNSQPLKNSKRIQITEPAQQGRLVSSLMFSPIYYKDSGVVSCKVTLNSGVESESKMSVNVLPKPTITIDQHTITSPYNQPISIQCESHVADSSQPENDMLPEITWYKNGEVLDTSDTEEIIKVSENIQQLQTRAVEDVYYSCSASNKAGESQWQTCSVTVLEDDTVYCEAETYMGVNWTMTAPGGVNVQACPQDMIGEAVRTCVSHTNGVSWGEPNLNQCVDKELAELFQQVERIDEGIGGTQENIEEVTAKLECITNVTVALAPGNLNLTAESLDMLAHVRIEDKSIEMSEDELNSVVNTISNLLNSVNDMAWGDLQQEDPMLSVSLMWTVDSYLDVATYYLPEDMAITVPSDNVVLQANKLSKSHLRDVTYPQMSEENKMEWMDLNTDSVSISRETLQALGNSIPGDSVALSSSYYKNINRLLPNKSPEDSEAYINSKVLAMSVLGLESGSKLDPPIQLDFVQNKNIPDNETGSCSFWDFEGEMWSTQGCSVVHTNSSHTSCECNHLTNFAVLVSRSPVTGKHAYILSLISIIGCVISIGAMVLTILIYISIWKHVKSHHAVVLINLCVALIIANLLFVTGVDKTSIRAVCISISVLLHYFYLAAFFLMLVEGIQLMLYIIYVFHVRRKRETAALIILGWVTPAVIVGACLGINKTEGYGTEDYCWLDSDSWLFWVFIVPAAIIIVINVIICVCVLRRISTSKIHQIDKSRHQKVKSAIWNIIVVMPILGITWLFGIFSVNNDILAFQYIFAVSNSLQGLFIFIFHALCNKKVRDTLCSRLGSSPTQTSSLLAHFTPGKKGRYHIKSSVRTQRSRLKSDSSGKSSNKSSKSFKSFKDAIFGSNKSKKKKNSLSNTAPESPAYDEIPADFLAFDDSGFPSHKPAPQHQNHHPHHQKYQVGDYEFPDEQQNRGKSDGNHSGDGGYANPSFLTFTGEHNPDIIDLSISENNNSDSAPVKKMTFLERLNSVNEMRTEEYMDVKLSTDNVRFRETPKSSPRLPRSTPFLARNSPRMPVKSQTSFNC